MSIENQMLELTVAIQNLTAAIRNGNVNNETKGQAVAMTAEKPTEKAANPAETAEEKEAKKAHRARLMKKCAALGINADAKFSTERLERMVKAAEDAEDAEEDEAPKSKKKAAPVEDAEDDEDEDDLEELKEAVKNGLAAYVTEHGKPKAGALIQKCGASTVKALSDDGLKKLYTLLEKADCITE